MASDDRPEPEILFGLGDLTTGLGFLTRIPGLPLEWQRPLPGRAAAAAWSFPIIGAGIGLLGGIAFIIANSIGLPSLVAGLLAVLTTAILTGGMHEAGLAATADAAAAATAPARLVLLRDGHLGARGGIALIMTIALRASALAGLVYLGEAQALFLLIAAEATSRAAMVRPWRALPPAGSDGVVSAVGVPDERGTTTAIVIGVAIAAVLALLVVNFWAAIVALIGTAAATLTFEAWARQRFGGHTPELLGACQQVAVAVYLLLALAFS